MSTRPAVGVLLIALIAALSGCSRGNAVPKAVPAAQSTKTAEKGTPPPPPSDPEPAPGEPLALVLPKDGGTWPWPVGRSEAAVESKPLSFPGLVPFAVMGFAVRPEVNRAAVSLKWEKKGQPIATRLVLCDTTTGKAVGEWQVPGLQTLLDLSPDGRAMLTTSNQPGRDRTVLRLWVVSSDGQLRKTAWTAHTTARPDGIRQEPGERTDTVTALEIRWAAFVANDRIASFSRIGQLRIFDSDTGKPLFFLNGSPGRPTVTPDGAKIAVFAGNSIAMVDPYLGTVVGSRWVGPLPQHPVLAFSPDGSTLAIGGNGKAKFLNMTSGDVRDAVMPKLHVTDTGMYDKPFGWAGNRFLFADGRLHDSRFPGAVWEYRGAEAVQFRGREVWLCSRPQGSSTSTITNDELPHLKELVSIAAAADSAGTTALKTGDGVRVDVSGVPEDHRADAQKALEQRLLALGYRIDPAAPSVLFASVDGAGTKTVTAYSGFDPFSYIRKPAVLRMVVNGAEVWSESWAVEPPFTIRVAGGQSLADYLKPFAIGEPNYSLFAQAPLPASFPGPQAPTAPLGATELKGERTKGWLW